MISDQNIICFGSESWGYKGFQQTLMRLLSHDNRILYINAIGTRKVSLNFSQLPFYFDRARKVFQKSKKKTQNALICNPRIIPLVYNDSIIRINKILMRQQLHKLIAKLHFGNYILWIGTPTAAFLLDSFEPVLTVYNPVDRYYAFPFVKRIKILKYEKQLAKKSDIIICTSDAIKRDLLLYNEHSYTINHGVDFNHFNSASTIESIPDDIKDIPKPIIGYFGALCDRINYELIYKVATRYPHVSLALIGEKVLNLNRLKRLKNIHLLGFRQFSALPFYLKQFVVCLIPYHVNELMEAVDPIKLREYLCLGKPVVSVDLPEVRKLERLVYIGENQEDFVNKVGLAMQENNSALVQERIHEAKSSDWPYKIEKIAEIINDALARKKRETNS